MRTNAIARGLAAAALTLGLAISAPADEVTLRAQTALPKKHDLSASFLDLFVARVNEVGKGVVKIDYIGGPEVTPVNKAAPALQRGVFDMLHTPAAYHAGIVPQGRALMATTLAPSEYRANGAFEMLAPHWKSKLNAHIVAIGETAAHFHLYTVKEPPIENGVLNLTGFKMRATGAYRPLLEALGATPVNMPAGEVLTGLQRGTVDGFGWPTVGLAALGLAKAVKYRIDPPFYNLANVVLVNADKWSALSQEARDVLAKVGAEYESASRQRMEEGASKDTEAAKAAGVALFELPDSARKDYLSKAYEAMWARAGEKVDAAELTALRAKMYQPE